MALTQRLELRQSHALVMTPQLMQAIKLLQLSNLDLAAYVEGELERNPLLERVGDDEAEGSLPTRADSSDTAAGDWVETSQSRDEGAAPEQSAVDLDDILPADADAATSRSNSDGLTAYSEWTGIGPAGRNNNDYNLEAFVSVETTLADHLAEQRIFGMSTLISRS